MNMIAHQTVSQDRRFPGSVAAANQGVVAIVTDSKACVENLAPVFDFLELRMEVVSTSAELVQVLQDINPMAVITDVEGENQDGFHTMKLVARYNTDLPIMLLTDAGLRVQPHSTVDGQLVAFLFSAGRKAGSMRLVPIC